MKVEGGDVKVFCQKCGSKNSDLDKFCIECGSNLQESSKEKVIVNNVIHNTTQATQYQSRQICLVCKGKGKKVNKIHMIISLLLGLILFPIVAMVTGGVTLIASIFILLWGLSKKKCNTCKGSGYLTM